MIDWIKDRILNQNRNYMGLVLGPTGAGKSYSSMRFAELIDKDFTIDNICFTPREFLSRLQDPAIKRGSCMILDEAGVSLGARDWYVNINKKICHVLQSFRYRNTATFFTVPNLRFIDSQARPLFHGLVEVLGADRKKGKCTVKCFWTESSPETGKIYKHYFTDENGVKINRHDVSLPSRRLINAYEKRKHEYADYLQKDALNEIDKEEKKNEPQEPNRRCEKCGYSWYYTGKTRPRCPACSSGVVVVATRGSI
jgi:predicted Zn-ribbon and HTH transcriptional regulator